MTALPWRLGEHGVGEVAHAVRTDRVECYLDGVPHHLTVCGWSISSKALTATDQDHRCTDCERAVNRSPPAAQLSLL